MFGTAPGAATRAKAMPGRSTEIQIRWLVRRYSRLILVYAQRSRHLGDLVTARDEQQEEAVRAPVTARQLVTAGPGCRKTYVACARVAHLLDRQCVASTAKLRVRGLSRLALTHARLTQWRAKHGAGAPYAGGDVGGGGFAGPTIACHPAASVA